MVRLRRVERRFAAAESLRRITWGLPAFTPLKSGERGTVVDAGDPSQALVRLRRTLRDFGELWGRGCIGRVARPRRGHLSSVFARDTVPDAARRVA